MFLLMASARGARSAAIRLAASAWVSMPEPAPMALTILAAAVVLLVVDVAAVVLVLAVDVLALAILVVMVFIYLYQPCIGTGRENSNLLLEVGKQGHLRHLGKAGLRGF